MPTTSNTPAEQKQNTNPLFYFATGGGANAPGEMAYYGSFSGFNAYDNTHLDIYFPSVKGCNTVDIVRLTIDAGQHKKIADILINQRAFAMANMPEDVAILNIFDGDASPIEAINPIITGCTITYGEQCGDCGGAVTQVATNAPGLSTGSPLVITPNTGNVGVRSMEYDGGSNIGYVPPGGVVGTYLNGAGNWSTPPGSSYSAMTDSVLGLGKLRYTTGATPVAESQSAVASRTYGVTENATNQLVVNVPWVAGGVSGTLGAIPKFDSSVSLGDSIMTESGSTIRITATTPKLAMTTSLAGTQRFEIQSSDTYTQFTNNSTWGYLFKDSASNNCMTIQDSNSRVGIGNVTSALSEFHVIGKITQVDGGEKIGQVLTSDAAGTGSWQEPKKILQQETRTYFANTWTVVKPWVILLNDFRTHGTQFTSIASLAPSVFGLFSDFRRATSAWTSISVAGWTMAGITNTAVQALGTGGQVKLVLFRCEPADGATSFTLSTQIIANINFHGTIDSVLNFSTGAVALSSALNVGEYWGIGIEYTVTAGVAAGSIPSMCFNAQAICSGN